MQFIDMVNEIINFRFNSTQDLYVKRWLNLREQQVWAQAEWPWKKLTDVTMQIDSGDSALDLPIAVRRVINVYDQTGQRLTWIPPDEFSNLYRGSTLTGVPSVYTLSSNQIILAPTASGNLSFSIDYERGIFHYDSTGTKVNGAMTDASDYPAWDDAWHWILVPGAMATGLKMENDPTYEPLEQEFLTGLDAMKEDLLPPSHASTLQYGRDTHGY
jgi:hypothetical protein